MKKIVVQIYEVQTPDEAESLINGGVDHLGSVVLDPERWKVAELKDTVRLAAQAGAKSSMIPLFSDPDTISRMLDFYRPAIVHFCEHLPLGDEGRKQLNDIFAVQRIVKQRFPEIQTMRTLPVGLPGEAETDDLLALLPEIEHLCDWFLTDTSPTAREAAPVPGFVGITGRPSDWAVVAKLVASTPVPVILAGGMSPENVYDGIVQTRPAGVDSCTQTNRRDPAGNPVRFSKDMDRVRRFVEETRRAEACIARDEANPDIS
ncbi:phosphoribosylanthranilate isomerase [Desulfosudis oleivorans]|uniref:N-(5'-phosphoribosyl)anthranilate isomerase n=1 Tax=Desulfosudis oleivorans (strain DSM 6200 / JCM 39069 / Hxd3) TaxID=96561 RepID=A8ZVH6_DESOH|nr:N-(5'-phosphoribosyl)anthranilate isomerase [Desulfosudis oleivorans]ABW68163.1 N-(5'phosphoribosyl)anthranilate isomerase (PRAI) [Desulfosudis oleivorans Hxd3]